jgi:hypothetical protein
MLNPTPSDRLPGRRISSRPSRVGADCVSAIVAPGAELQRRSRAGVALLLALALANGICLYFVPAHAEANYAWAVVPPINAAFIGAGFLAGCIATALVTFVARSWRSLRMLALPLFVLATTLTVATLLHAAKFRWSYPPTWIWTAVYALVPIGIVLVWRRQEGLPAPVADPALRPLRASSLGLGAVLGAVGALLFAVPTEIATIWPWQITELTGRVLGSWYLMVGTSLLVCAVTLRRPHEVVIPYATLLAWTVLLLALPLLHTDQVNTGSWLDAWVAMQIALLVLAAYALMRALPIMRAAGERL